MKKYVITGSIGHISKPIIEALVNAGKEVVVITSSNDRVKEIEALGANAVVGQVQDAAFVKDVFRGADVVYTMIPPIWQTSNWKSSQLEVAKTYADAIEENGIRYVVNLSSIGADIGSGVGPVDALHDFEKMLNGISSLNVKHLRPSFFYYNLLAQIGLIKQAGFMGANYGADSVFLVHPKDIAQAAAEELLSLSFEGNSVRYVIGDERTGREIAQVLGRAIGKELNWVEFTDEQQKHGLLQAGLSETHASGYTDMGMSLRQGNMQRDAKKNKPVFAATKLEDFAKEFAAAFK
ncbi:NAD(P)H-binding protein [Chryseolinea sp. T2]|uniref:NAD(P)H-binding protein n=1 Tax=Chryseolinea sp. T2 TaxID=3129255 RepID=UPI003076EC16